jgi:LPXTG-site transpeptidase (sortase) family protein
VILFGHSSYLPIVNNKAFKAFNGIQDLEAGDRILVTGTSRTFVYEVTSVREADALEDAIPLMASGNRLTLATCDSFGKKTARFIVTADLVESYPAGK